MVSTLNLTIAILWFLSAVVDYSDYSYLWQLKEYRLDRMRDFFSTRQGKMYLLRYQLAIRSFLAAALSLWPINEVLTLKYILIIIFCIDIIHTAVRFGHGKIRHPRITPKAVLVIGLSLVLESALIVFLHDWSIVFVLMIIRFVIIAAVAIILTVPTRLLKQYYIRLAAKKISRYPNLIVIGVTGSFGKSSVKEFLAHILSSKYAVIRTPLNINTEIGVAQFILRSSFEGKQVFIVEMGAYRIGEISLVCEMVHPTIGVLTAINEQHLSLFGSIQHTQEAKYELLRSLPSSGLAVANSDNPYCREFLSELASPVATFGYDEEYAPSCQITEVEKTHEGVACVLAVGKETLRLGTQLIGEYHCMNIAPCVLVAKRLGMTNEEIIEQCKTLPQTGIRRYPYGKCTIIDDSYNSNPDGFKSALVVMSAFPSSKRRIVVTRGMLELGTRSDELHERIGEEISFTADELVLLTRDFEAPLRKGVGTKYRTTIVVKDKPAELLEFIRSKKNTDCVILLENRVPSVVYQEITQRT